MIPPKGGGAFPDFCIRVCQFVNVNPALTAGVLLLWYTYRKGVVFRCTPLTKLTQMYCRCIQPWHTSCIGGVSKMWCTKGVFLFLSHISSGIGVLEEYSLAWDSCTLRSTPYILCCPIWGSILLTGRTPLPLNDTNIWYFYTSQYPIFPNCSLRA